MIGDAYEALYARLTAPGSVATLVGTRVYPVKLPQGVTFPAISYALSGEQRLSSFAGPIGLPGQLYTIDCWGGKNFVDARTLAKAVRLSLDGAERWTAAGVNVQVSILEGQHDIYEDDVDIHRVSMDVRLWWEEPQS